MGSLSTSPTVTLGIDIGQQQDPTALCVAEKQERFENGSSIAHFLIRHLERLPLGTPYPTVVQRIDSIADTLLKRTGSRPLVYLDATGVGKPIVDLLRTRMGRASALVAVTFTAGAKRELRAGDPLRMSLGKEYLACRLAALLAGRRIHLPPTAEGRALAAELQNYEVRVDQGGHARFGAFRAGTHDDLVTALALAINDGQREDTSCR